MKKDGITRFKLNAKRPPKTDWRAFDAMSDADRDRAALADADARPASRARLARARRVLSVRALRQQLNLTQRQFATRSTFRSGRCGIGSRERIARTRLRKCY